ncbi:MAG: FAD-dependent oxidoreductase [Chloroflexota bacterium]
MRQKSEVLVIGGGVIGVCSALYLTRAGYQVTLLEKKDICSGASHGNACWIAVAHSEPVAAPGVITQGLKWLLDNKSPFYIKPRINLDLMRWLWQFRKASTVEQAERGTRINLALSRQSLSLYKELVEEGLAFDFAQKGLLHVHLSEKAKKAGKAELSRLKRFGIEGRMLRKHELKTLEPGLSAEIESGTFYPEPAQVRPHKMVQAIATQAEKEGACIHTGIAVKRLETRSGEVVAVHTDRGLFSGDHVVLAAGAWTSILAKSLGIYLCMEPAKGYSLTAKRPTPLHGPSRAVSVDDYKLAVSPLGPNFRFSSTLALAGFDPSINRKRLATNSEGLNRVYSGMEDLKVIETWSGYRPLTADSLPIIGKMPGLDNLIFATGHGMLGMTQGSVTGKLVSQIVANERTSVDLNPLRPNRF